MGPWGEIYLKLFLHISLRKGSFRMCCPESGLRPRKLGMNVSVPCQGGLQNLGIKELHCLEVSY